MNLKNIFVSLLIVAIVATLIVALCVAVYYLVVPSTGTIEPKYELIAEPSSIAWGAVTLNTPIIQSIDITNTGTKDVASLNMTYTLVSGTLTTYTVTWDCEDEILPVGYAITASFTLTVYEATEGAFQIDLHISDKA